jgi:hypothetical protein
MSVRRESRSVKPHPQNVPGPFYVQHECCITCGVPVETAPDNFDWTEAKDHCFVKRQPVGPEETDRTLRAMWSSEVDCIRYRGNDPAILGRIAQFGFAGCCDSAKTAVAEEIVRDRVAFRSPRTGDGAAKIAERFRTHLLQPREFPRFTIRRRRLWAPSRVILSWTAGISGSRQFHTVVFEEHAAAPEAFGARLESRHRGALQGLGLLIHDWLVSDGAQALRWWSSGERSPGETALHMPM